MTPAKRFAEMKDSGIEWVGMIPAHWHINVLFQLVSQVKNKNKDLSETNLLSLSYGKIKRKNIDDTEGLLPASFDSYNIIENNDIVLRLTDLQNDHTSLRVGRATERGIITSAYITIRPTNSRMSEYLYYLLHSFDIKKGFYGMGSGVRQGLNYDEVKMLKLPLPPLNEESAIAAYLDTQCAKIDEIIAQAKASIEDYKQWKASIIYEAVTKGLDPNVEMKDSGIPCVDKVPKHWTVTRFGKIAAVKSNLVNPKDYQSYKQISPENIEKGSGVLLDCVTVEESGVISGNHLFYKGQILYSKIRPTLNKVIIAPFDGLCSADMYPIDTDHCSRFILYLMLSAYFNEQVALVTGNRVKMPKINQNELSQIMVAIPSDTEEQQIAKYLDLSCSQIDVLIKEKQSLIDDLESYKKSLIYEVVTGKRGVC